MKEAILLFSGLCILIGLTGGTTAGLLFLGLGLFCFVTATR